MVATPEPDAIRGLADLLRAWFGRLCGCGSGGFGRPALLAGLEPSTRDHVAVPARAVLEDPALGREVDVHQTEAPGVALVPLEVVEQRPDEVAAQVDALLQRLMGGAEMPLEETDAVGVVHVALRVGVVVEGSPVLGHHQRDRPAAPAGRR